MNIRQPLNTTKNFYKEISQEFSNTRQYPWKGWEKAFKAVNVVENTKVLDLGCGNGRFYEFLEKNTEERFEYTGIDNNKELLNIAKEKYPKGKFENIDILENIERIEGTYDLVVGFGITHHIPNKEFRLKWFNQVSKMVDKEGYLILSFWNFLDKKSLIRAEELEGNDYWLGWGEKDVKRYCHYYNEKELREIDRILENNRLILEKEIRNTQDLNTYKIYRYN